jgi:hypothetical protein
VGILLEEKWSIVKGEEVGMSSDIIIRDATWQDAEGIHELYLKVAKAFPDSITQHISELSVEFVKEIMALTIRYGLALVAEDESGAIVGFFRAYTSPYRVLAHVMKNTTLISIPDQRGTRIFVRLLRKYLQELKERFRHIYKLQGLPHETNRAAISCYLRNGIVSDVVLVDNIYNFNKERLENEVVVSWLNPNFDMEELKKYHQYLPTAHLKCDTYYTTPPLIR